MTQHADDAHDAGLFSPPPADEAFDPLATFAAGTSTARLARLRDAAERAYAAFTLDERQRQAAEHDAGPLAVLAGPGAGKTRVITARVLRLLAAGADPKTILAVTFTVKAAGEMRERLGETIENASDAATATFVDRVRISTFHALGAALLNRFGDTLGLPAQTRVMDSAERTKLLRRIITEHGLFSFRAAEALDTHAEGVRAFIDACHNAARSPEDALDFADRWQRRLDEQAGSEEDDAEAADAFAAERYECALFTARARAFELFETEVVRTGALTFNHFITLPIRLLREDENIAAVVRAELRHVVVDEFQDVNPAQIELLKLLIPPREHRAGPDLCIVGDDDQAIYAFRGSHPDAFRTFAETWTNAETVTLATNYRSAPEIVGVAGCIMERAESRAPRDEAIRAHNTEPGSIEGVLLADDRHAGVTIAAAIEHDVRTRDDASYADYAVIARNNTEADRIAIDLEAAGVPVDRRVAPDPRENETFRDLWAWINALLEPDADHHASRLLLRPPFSVEPRRLAGWAKQHRIALSRGLPDGADPTFVGFLAGADDPQNHASVRTMLDVLAALRDSALTLPADRAIERIARETNVIEHAAPDETAEALRVVAELLRFARQKLPVLDEPRDLRAFKQHYDLLDDTEQRLAAPSVDQLDAAADEDDEQALNAVTVITAHKAKGLEFDTVFVPRVRPGWGYPSSARSDDDPPAPLDFLGLPEPSHADEERRVFYVAATRAVRRLVLLAKFKKSRGSSTDYFIELEDAAGPAAEAPIAFAVGDAEPIVDRARTDLGLTLTIPDVDEAEFNPAEEAERVRSIVLSDAQSRLAHAARAGLDAGALRALIDQLADDARTLAATRAIVEGREPVALPEAAPALELLERVRTAVRDRSLPSVITPPTPPLTISFSQITHYERCPACYYASRVLGIDEPKSAQLHLGDAVHHALQQHVRAVEDAQGEGRPGPSADDLARRTARYAQDHWPVGVPFDPEIVDRARAMAYNFVEHFERPDADNAQVLALERSISIPIVLDGVEHRLVVKVDRLDQLSDGTVRIVDYKTGAATKKRTEHDKLRKDLQLGIYALALPALLDEQAAVTKLNLDEPNALADRLQQAGLAQARGEYWLLGPAVRGVIGLDDIRLESVVASIAKAVRGILAGAFPRGRDHQSPAGRGSAPCGLIPTRLLDASAERR
jgi:DNA helicase-2/ATP-dependent DNA helicase PcrA